MRQQRLPNEVSRPLTPQYSVTGAPEVGAGQDGAGNHYPADPDWSVQRQRVSVPPVSGHRVPGPNRTGV